MRTCRYAALGSDGQPYTVFIRMKTATELAVPRERRPQARWLRARFYLGNGDELVPTDDCTVFRKPGGDAVLITLLAV